MSRLTELLERFGRHSNAYLSTYPGYERFEDARGIESYVETRGAWVGASDPLASPEDTGPLLSAFAAAANAAGKDAIAFPVSRAVAQAAEAQGFGAAMIGTEVIIDLTDTEPRPEFISTARRLALQRVGVDEFRPEALSEKERTELDEILQEWLDTRRTEALSFLNRVEPWTRPEGKAYFRIRKPGHETLAYLAAAPMPASRGWYFVDLIRRRSAPAGTTELLILEAARQLRDRGAREISLGVSPLAGLNPTEFRDKRIGYAVLKAFYGRGKFFYNFGSLFAFKLKFRPTRLDPVYIIYKPAKFTVFTVRHILDAFYPGGLLPAIGRSVDRAWRRFDTADVLEPHLKPGIVARSHPRSQREWLYRCKLTLAVIPIQIFLFLETLSPRNRLKWGVAREWAFSGKTYSEDAIKSVLLSPFLHWDWLHFSTNMVLTFVFCGLLETLAGTGFLALCYFLPLFLANPLTYWCLIWPLQWVAPHWWHLTYLEPDVGSSLGIYGAIGALFFFLDRNAILLWGFGLAAVAFALWTHSLIPLNHIVAMGMGTVLAGFMLNGLRRRVS